MSVVGRQRMSLFVDRTSSHRIVRDPEGNLWIAPSTDSPWEHRQPYAVSDGGHLERVPTHHAYVLKLPF